MSVDRETIDARYAAGNDLRRRGNIAAAESELRAVLQADPSHRDAAYSLAFMLREEGRVEAAATVVANGWQHAAPDAEATLAALGFLLECSAFSTAATLVLEARQRWPEDARLAARAGEILLALGQFDAARTHLDAAIDRDPNQSAAWLRLSYCQRYRDPSDPDIARFESASNDTRLLPITRVCAQFALGKALDETGAAQRAALTFRQANIGARALQPWNERGWNTFVEKRMRENVAAPVAHSKFEPVFVIGLPRTGTTLVSTLLARHDDVRDRGELNWIPSFYTHLADAGRLGDADALSACAALIQAQMRRDDAPARFYVDKNPLNFAYVDFIVALFPRARFIYCRRDARDTALSIWMQHFAHSDLGFAYDLATIARVDADHRRLMERWKNRFADRIIDVDYEALVSDPEFHAARLATFVTGRSSASKAPRRDQIVTTASVWQARQPVYASSIGRWRNYAAYLPELERLFPAETV
ncbi:MAG: sulfotransferase [Rudaea sp.]